MFRMNSHVNKTNRFFNGSDSAEMTSRVLYYNNYSPQAQLLLLNNPLRLGDYTTILTFP